MVIDALARQVALFVFYYFRLNWFGVVWEPRSASQSFEYPAKQVTPNWNGNDAVSSTQNTIVHNARERQKPFTFNSILRASKKMLWITFSLHLFLTARRAPKTRIFRQYWNTQLHSVRVKWIKKFIDCHTWLQTCNKHVHASLSL